MSIKSRYLHTKWQILSCVPCQRSIAPDPDRRDGQPSKARRNLVWPSEHTASWDKLTTHRYYTLGSTRRDTVKTLVKRRTFYLTKVVSVSSMSRLHSGERRENSLLPSAIRALKSRMALGTRLSRARSNAFPPPPPSFPSLPAQIFFTGLALASISLLRSQQRN